MDEMNTKERKMYVSLRAGTSIIKLKPCFSYDSRYLFVAAGSVLKVLVTATGDCLHKLGSEKEEPIVSMFSNVGKDRQFITLSSVGNLSYWDYEYGILIRVVKLNRDVLFAFPNTKANSFYVAAPVFDCLMIVDVEFTNCSVKSSAKTNIMIPESLKMVALSKNYIATVKENLLKIYGTNDNFVRKHYVKDEMNLTCVAWHPTEECIATSDHLGCILLWYNFSGNVFKSILHWHSQSVTDLSFTSSGSYLFSGGGECVLVKWNISVLEKQFIPRMGLPLCHVACSPDNTYVVTSHVDNSLSVVDSNMDIMGIVHNFYCTNEWKYTSEDPVPVGLLFNPTACCLILNGRPGHLQFYDFKIDKQLYNLDITQQNYISPRRDFLVNNLEVVKAAIDDDGNWLATIEQIDDNITSLEMRLKFFNYQFDKKGYELNTTIEMPHRKKVNCLLFQPSKKLASSSKLLAPLLVSTSEDKQIRIWSLVEDAVNPIKQKFWSCRGVAFYHDLPAGIASFSEDGSVLAAAFDNVLTLWLPIDNVLRTTLSHSRTQDSIRQVVFGRYDCSHLIVTDTSDSLIVWDTLSLSILWSVKVNVSHLVGDFASNVMAAFTESGDLFLFTPMSPEPQTIVENVTDAKVLSGLFVPSDKDENKSSQLFFIDGNQKLYSVSDTPSENVSETKRSKTEIQSNIPMTPFGMLIAEQQKSGVVQVEAKFHELVGSSHKKVIKEILNTPSHVLPPASEICSIFLASLLKSLKLSENANEDEDDDNDAESEGNKSHHDSDSDEGVKKGDADVKPMESDAPLEVTNISDFQVSKRQLFAVRNTNYSWVTSK